MSKSNIEWTQLRQSNNRHVERENINQRRVAFAKVIAKPFFQILIVFFAIAGSATGHDVSIFRFSATDHRRYVVPSVGRLGAVGATTIELFEKIGLRFCRDRLETPLSVMSVLSPLGPVGWVGCESRSICGINARTTSSAPYRIAREPLGTSGTPCESQHPIYFSFGIGWKQVIPMPGSTVNADSRPSIVAAFVYPKNGDGLPSPAPVTPLLLGAGSENVFIEGDSDAFCGDFYRSEIASHVHSI